MSNANPKQPVSLYFHIPFCKVKCIYCDFYSVVRRDNQIPLFTESLIREFQNAPPPADKYDSIKTIYFGGGTPSMLSGRQLEKILTAVTDHLPLQEGAEITLEVNPGEVDVERLSAYHSIGVNRVSLGLQSFDNAQLERLGRLHRREHNIPSIEMARKSGFENINVDLIFHLPEQSLEDFSSDLTQMLALDTEHISIYSLTVEEGTPLFQYVRDGRISMTPDDLDAEMYRHLCQKMQEAGFDHYEVSNFGKPGFHSEHNSNYWDRSHYYSYGPSAHSYNGEMRWWNVRDLSEYFLLVQEGRNPVAEREVITPDLKRNEYFLTRLRTWNGVHFAEWEEEFGEPFPKPVFNYFLQVNDEHPAWIQMGEHGFRLTEEGWLFNDYIVGRCVDKLKAA